VLSSQEQMEIIKGALSEGYKGPIFKLIEQAEIKKQEESEQTEEPEQRETGGLVQSYAPTPPNVGNVLTGPKIGKGKFLENAEQYRGGGFNKKDHGGIHETDPEDKPKETSWLDYMNPRNWGVSDRDDDGTFKEAFSASDKEGENEFMWRGTRYSTDKKGERPKFTAPLQVRQDLYKKFLHQITL